MTKTNDISKPRIEDVEALGGAATSTVRELRDNELEEVSGGYTFNNVMVESIVAPRDFNSLHTVDFVAPLMPQFDE